MPLYGFTPKGRHIGRFAAWLEQRQILSARATQATATPQPRQADVSGARFSAPGFAPTRGVAGGTDPPARRRLLPVVRAVTAGFASESAESSGASAAPSVVPTAAAGF